ncbi:MAG TPA: hydroxymethylbilane synthase, partial [Synechococcales bacterium UBA10510]|nr:hydroxymethylbilane synthase [Synechococcales bacterium UBA10510]
EFDCLILAAAGLGRLGLGDRIHELIDASISLHAVGQGALGIECRQGDAAVLAQIKLLEHLPTTRRCLAERAFLRELEGGCQVPIGVNSSFAEADGDASDGGQELILTGMVASLDGTKLIRDQARGAAEDPESIGIALALKLREQGAGEILEQIFADVRPQA